MTEWPEIDWWTIDAADESVATAAIEESDLESADASLAIAGAFAALGVHRLLSEDEAQAAMKRELHFASPNNLREGSYALDAIRRDLTRILEKENIRDGGLIIETTLDSSIQKIAEKAVEKHLAKLERRPGYRHQKRSQWNGRGDPEYLQGAAVVIDL